MALTKLYKALVKDENSQLKIIESYYSNKKDFIRDLRNNGYKVNPIKVKKAEVFDFIMANTNCNEWDWKENR